MRNQLLIELYKQTQTVFTLKEVSLLVPDVEYTNLRQRMVYLAKTGAIRRLAHGVYAKENYNPLELANKLYVPSYVSLETVLRQAGVVFQHYDRIFSVSYSPRTASIDGQIFEYRQVSRNILLDKRGVLGGSNVLIASPERAFLDAVYLYKSYHFDNLGALDWERVNALVGLYRSKALQKRVNEYYQIYQGEHVG